MVDPTEIEITLRKLDAMYNGTADLDLLNWYAKLSMLEFCGWIETTMDSIVLSFSNRKLLDQKYKDMCTGIMKKTHGFLYDGHFKEMLCKIIGLHNLERFEVSLGDTTIDTLNRELSKLWLLRSELAHTFTDSMKTYKTSPSTVLNGNLRTLLPILVSMQTVVDAIA